MAKLLFLYSTREGHTKKVLKFIGDQTGQTYEFFNLHELPQLDFSSYEKILIGASIHYGRLDKKLYQFIANHQELLANHKAAFVCINLTARKEDQLKDTPEGSPYVKTFLKKSVWQPALIGVFAGALKYPQYGWFDKFMIRLIMKMTQGETDTSKEFEFTNWNKVEKFAQKFKEM